MEQGRRRERRTLFDSDGVLPISPRDLDLLGLCLRKQIPQGSKTAQILSPDTRALLLPCGICSLRHRPHMASFPQKLSIFLSRFRPNHSSGWHLPFWGSATSSQALLVHLQPQLSVCSPGTSHSLVALLAFDHRLPSMPLWISWRPQESRWERDVHLWPSSAYRASCQGPCYCSCLLVGSARRLPPSWDLWWQAAHSSPLVSNPQSTKNFQLLPLYSGEGAGKEQCVPLGPSWNYYAPQDSGTPEGALLTS